MNKRILLIDDDAYILDVYEEVLKSAGYAVDTAIDGQQGLDKLRQGGYDLVLLDIMMPRLDGLGILTFIADNPPPVKNGPIIILSNLDNDLKIKKTLQKGAKAYLIKTNVTPEQLLDKVKKLLNVQ